LRRALPSVEHFVFCHPDSSLLKLIQPYFVLGL
jgi:hypothetical protein